MSEAGVSDTDPGIALLATVIPALEKTIEEKQQEIVDDIKKGGTGRKFSWALPFLCLSADRMAYITARIVLSEAVRYSSSVPTRVAGTAVAIANAIRQEREFQLWKDRQNKAEKEGAAINLAKLMMSSTRRLDRRTASKWMNRGATFDRLEWSTEEKIQLGTVLIHMLISTGGGMFDLEVVHRGTGNRRKSAIVVSVTEKATHFLRDHAAREELMRPWLLPMLCPPNDWVEV